MGEDSSQNSERVRELFRRWLDEGHDPATDGVDELLARHPEHAAALERLADEAAVDGSVEIGADGDPSSSAWQRLVDQLRERGPGHTRYVFEGEVAQGGMGVIHRVFDRDARRRLALKVMLGSGCVQKTGDTPATDDASLGRFLEEAQVTSQLDHPGIVPVHEIGLDADDRIYFTMKLVKGEDLRSVFDRVSDPNDGGWNETRVLSVLLRVCEAMAYAHDKGVIHRDLKPGNVMVGKYGETYVMDWGLARVLGRDDAHDLRLRPDATSSLHSDRADAAAATPDSPILTMDGAVVGTPAYMPPEQAKGRVEEVGPPADVYAVGAMLYHLLTGRMPYTDPGDRISPRTILALVTQAPPKPLHELRKDVPAELQAICERAMAREIADRYPDMTALARDLRAYLENRVVAAYESGPIAELKKWVVRNPVLTWTLTASLAAVLALSGWALVERQTALENEQTAISNETLARANEKTATARKAEFDQLKGVVLLKTALENEKNLYPAWPEKIEAMERWLAQDAAKLLELKPTLFRTLSVLQDRSLPWSDEGRQADRTTLARFAELAQQTLRVEAARRAQAVRTGGEHPVLPGLSELPAELKDASASKLVEFVWARIDLDEEDRIVGEEPLALVAARQALSLLEGGDDSISRTELLVALARVSFRNGLDDEARSRLDEAIVSAPDDRKAPLEKVRDSLQEAISSWTGEAGREALAALESELSTLEDVISTRRTYRFDDESQQFLYDTLSDLSAKILAFESGACTDVERRLSWARRIDGLTRNHPNSTATWEEAREAIAAADGVLASELYAEHPIDLLPQVGLVPIGMNPVTLLWEFYDLRSAYDPASGLAPESTVIPEHRDDGTLEIREETGLVFVLIPGGTYRMGAQSSDPNAPHYDPMADSDESPVHEVVLEPYFLSRYEMTQGQWLRIAGENPSTFNADSYPTHSNAMGLEADLTHPVEQVSWDDCVTNLTRIGLRLPSEAQWEAACRAGTDTPWWTGAELADLDEVGNLADQYMRAHGAPASWPFEADLDDGNSLTARVGSYRANAFGLHDVIGNVLEWCLDTLDTLLTYNSTGRVGDGARIGQNPNATVVYRGGSFVSIAWHARSAYRHINPPAFQSDTTGCRPARDIRGP